MFFRTPRFIRRWFRKKMHPMAEESAWSVKQKLSIAYMLIAWNAFGFVIYQMSKGNKSWPLTYGLTTPEEESIRPAYRYAKALGIKAADVYRVDKRGIGDKEVITVEDTVQPVNTGETSVET